MSKAIIAKTANLFSSLVRGEAFSGILLILTSVGAILWANSPGGQYYFDLWQTKFTITFGGFGFSKPLLLWINDGLMAMFITGLAFSNPEWVEVAKVGVLLASIIAGFVGFLILHFSLKPFKKGGKRELQNRNK